MIGRIDTGTKICGSTSCRFFKCADKGFRILIADDFTYVFNAQRRKSQEVLTLLHPDVRKKLGESIAGYIFDQPGTVLS